MSKAKQLKCQPRTKRDPRTSDAAELIFGFRQWATARPTNLQDVHLTTVARETLAQWESSQVVLRVDEDFAAALLRSDTNVSLATNLLAGQPFDSFAALFPIPIAVHDGHRTGHYTGFMASGILSSNICQSPTPERGVGTVHTDCVPLSQADGVRFVWLYHHPSATGSVRLHTTPVYLRGPLARGRTLTEVTAGPIDSSESFRDKFGDELPTLIPLAMQLLAYLTADQPDIDWPASESRLSRDVGSAERVRIGHMGFRVGSDLRAETLSRPSRACRTLRPGQAPRVPHVRRGHWRRVRRLIRDASGVAVGSVSGTQGVDWEYALQWIRPSTVNALPTDPHPTVRQLV